MAGPYDLLFGPNADPLRAIAMAGVRPAREPSPLPDVPREEQDRLLGTLGETSLGGLAYLGKTLDKPGRAVRGLLAGNPREALNVLPFSDALGLTDERDTVSGTDLNARWGLTTPGDDSWANLGAGFATEVLLDPLTYVGVGPLTKAGKVLQKAGQLPRGFAPKVAGEGFVRESRIAPTLAAGQQAIDSPLLKGGKTLVTSGTEGRAAAEGVDIAEGTPLASLLGVGLPFMEPAFQFGTGKFAQGTAGLLDKIGGGIAASAPVRAIRAAIDPTAGGVTNREVQRIVGETARPATDAAKASYREGVYDLLREANPLIEKDQRAAADVIRMAAEFDPAAPVLAGSRPLRDQARARAVAAGYSPAEADLAVDIGERLGKHVRTAGPGELARGVNRADLEDAAVDYFTRSKNDIPRQPGESWPSYVRRLTDDFSARHGSTVERLPFLKGVPGGTVQVNDWAKDPALKAMTDLQREAYFRQALTGSPTPIGNKPAYAQAAQLSKWIGSLPEVYSKDGIDFFRPDPFADAVLRGDRASKALGTAEGVYRAVRDFGEPAAALGARGLGDTVPASAVMEAVGLGGPKGAGPPGGVMTNRADDIVRQRTGLSPADDVSNLHLPGDIARDLIRVHTAWQTPQQLGPVAAAWDMVSNLFKTWLTTPFPAFHTRNMVTGLFNQWRDGALSPAALKEAYTVMRGGQLAAGPAATNELIREAVSRGVAFTPDAGRSGDVTAQAAGLIDPGRFPKASGNTLIGDAVRAVGEQAARVYDAPAQNLLNPANITGVAGATDANAVIALGRKAQAFGDDLVRLSHYLAKRQQGFSPDAAALAVKKYHMDWQDLTGTERNVLRRVIPFYCMPIDHEILTRNGWKFYDQIAVGDEVLACDHQAGTFHWTPLLAVNEFDYDGDLMSFECRGAGFEFTPNHKWPTETTYKGKRELLEGHDVNTSHRIPLTANFAGTESVLSPRHAAILGWVVTDGYFRWRCDHCEMVVYQSTKKYVQEVASLLGCDAVLACDEKQPNKVYRLQVRRDDVIAITEIFRGKDDMPAIAAGLSREAAEAMYDAMMKAEGTNVGREGRPQQHFAQSPKNWQVTDAFQVLCVLTGRSAFRTKSGCYIRKTAHIWPKHWARPNKHYAGKVWCPTTAYGTWVVRHNGAVAITGNSFSRKNLPPVLEDLVTRPAKTALALRGVAGVREPFEFVPGYVAEGASIPIPGAPEGQQRYVSSFGLPIEDELLKAIGSIGSGDISRGLQQVLGMSQPFVKAPIEQAFGTQLFSGRDLDQLRPYGTLRDLGLFNEENNRLISQAVANTPASRFATTIDKFLDERKGTLPTLLNTLTGARVTDVDADRQRDLAAKRLLQDALRGKSGVRVSEDVYVPRENLPLLDPLEMQLYAAYKAASNRVRQQAKERAQQQGAGR